MKAKEIFTPGTLPKYTYYERPNRNLEETLLNAVDTPGVITAVSGPSKSGKTVLCESVIGVNSMLLVTGGGVDSEATFWQRIRSRLKVPAGSSTSNSESKSREIGASAKGGFGFIFKGEGGVDGKLGRAEQEQSTLQFDPISGVDLLGLVRNSKRTLVVDDFHYINRSIQSSLVEQFKEAARAGCTIVVVSVPHRSDDVIRANPDLRGRLRLVEVAYWTEEELLNIPKRGFPLLNIHPDESVFYRFARESLSSPQLMQSLCLDLCRTVGVDETLPVDGPDLVVDEKVLTQTLTGVANASSCQTALDILMKGPRVRGTERKTYRLKEGSIGDVYTVVLKAIASGEPKLTLKYPEIRGRVELITDGEPPSGSSIVSTLTQMDEAAQEMRHDRVLEWDAEKETLNFPDPYFLYFLRWRS